MKKVMIIISLISIVLIAIGCGQTKSQDNLETFNKAKDKIKTGTQKVLDDYYKNQGR